MVTLFYRYHTTRAGRGRHLRPSPVPPHPVLVYGVDDHHVDEHAHGDAPRRHEQRDPGVLAVVGYADAGGRTQHPERTDVTHRDWEILHRVHRGGAVPDADEAGR